MRQQHVRVPPSTWQPVHVVHLHLQDRPTDRRGSTCKQTHNYSNRCSPVTSTAGQLLRPRPTARRTTPGRQTAWPGGLRATQAPATYPHDSHCCRYWHQTSSGHTKVYQAVHSMLHGTVMPFEHVE
jgi:hypothetical protein